MERRRQEQLVLWFSMPNKIIQDDQKKRVIFFDSENIQESLDFVGDIPKEKDVIYSFSEKCPIPLRMMLRHRLVVGRQFAKREGR